MDLLSGYMGGIGFFSIVLFETGELSRATIEFFILNIEDDLFLAQIKQFF
jgi:hypothetical protein